MDWGRRLSNDNLEGKIDVKKFYEKSEIWFSVLLIVLYVVGSSVADDLSRAVGVTKSVTLVFQFALAAVIWLFIRRNGLEKTYGLCKPAYPASRFLFYVPLVVLASVNLWFGVQANYPAAETLCYVGSMLLVGALEELIFRGFLFKAISKSNVTRAIVISSVTFGIGHIVNLVNGSGADLLSNLCQVCYAVAIGFLFVIIFYKGKSLVPCIVTHSVLNSLGAFGNEAANHAHVLLTSAVLIVVSVAYSLIIIKGVDKPGERA